jgi:hypothetical protein
LRGPAKHPLRSIKSYADTCAQAGLAAPQRLLKAPLRCTEAIGFFARRWTTAFSFAAFLGMSPEKAPLLL